jgi:hypothetical protein
LAKGSAMLRDLIRTYPSKITKEYWGTIDTFYIQKIYIYRERERENGCPAKERKK